MCACVCLGLRVYRSALGDLGELLESVSGNENKNREEQAAERDDLNFYIRENRPPRHIG